MNFTAAFQRGINLYITRGINGEFIVGVNIAGVITVIDFIIRIAVCNILEDEVVIDVQFQGII